VAGALVAIAAAAIIEGAASAWLMTQDIRNIRFDAALHANVFDSLLGWTGEPNAHRTDWFAPGMTLTNNAEGMRVHRPTTPILPPGKLRAICSGDSFTNGWGVGDSETFCAQLETELPDVETLNMARGGFGIDQSYLWYKRDAVRWPHQLHLFAFIWHDFERMSMHSFWGRQKPFLRAAGDSVVVENVPVSPNGSSPRWTYAAQMLPRLRVFQAITRRVAVSESAQMARIDQSEWPVAENVFKDLDRLNRQRGSQLVLIYLPTTADLSRGPQDARRKHLAEFAQRAKLPLIDLTDAVRAVPADSSQWFFITDNQWPVDGASGHYTVVGNRWVAHQLAERLRHMPETSAIVRASTAQ
jgi:hypothetical protein